MTTVEEQLQATMKQLLVLAQAMNKNKVREGYYAVDLGEGPKRYHMSVGRPDGDWADWKFLSTGSDYHDRKLILRVKPDGSHAGKPTTHAQQVYAMIVADPVKAMLLYSEITGVCGVCGRKLEDPTSVAIGIGPVCLQRLIGN